MRRDERGPWYLFTGLVIGIGFGLLYSWVISPVRYIDAAPRSLREDFKDQYRMMIASAYMATGDLERAKARLALLDDPEIDRTLTIQAQRALAEGRPEPETRALGLLAVALTTGPVTLQPTALPSITATPGLTNTTSTPSLTPTHVVSINTDSPGEGMPLGPTPTRTPDPRFPTGTPTPTPTLLPTRTATPTPGSLFVLSEQTFLCDSKITQPLIQVITLDAAGNPVPGVEIIVSWGGGEDHFFTGLKPEISLGYADFSMQPGVSYAVRLAEGGETVPDLTPRECEQGGERIWGSWLLTYSQP